MSVRGAVCAAFLLLISKAWAAEPTVAAGATHSLALAADGSVYSWGSDAYGQLGLSRTLFRTQGVTVDLPPAAKVSNAAAGRAHSLAVLGDGSVYSWGDNGSGQLGDGTQAARSLPQKVALAATARRVSSGNDFSVALLQDGTVWDWGMNDNGELGLGKKSSQLTPARIPNLANITQISSGNAHSIALDNAGSIWTWGRNSYGQLGDGAGSQRLTVGKVKLNVTASRVAAGGDASYALDSSGQVWSWGRNDYFQLGDGGSNDRADPALVAGLSKVIALSAGTYGAAAVTQDGKLWLWGGTLQTPTPVTGITSAVDVSMNEQNIDLLLADGSVLALGNNDSGQLGNGTTVRADAFSKAVGLPPMQALATGLQHAMAVSRDGVLWSWGSNASGQLGEARQLERAVPSQIPQLSNVVQIASGDNHALALKADGSVWAWGLNAHGALGDGTEQDKASPVAVIGLPAIKSIYAGGESSAALAVDGTLWTWGSNLSGQLGFDSDTIRYAVKPMQLSTLNSVSSIAVGDRLMLALRRDGTVWAWGENTAGQLGVGDKLPKSGVVQVSGLSNIVAIGAGASHGLAVKADGSVFSWGNGASGQLGNSDSPINQLLPVQVKGLSDIKAVDGGQNYSVAVSNDGKLYTWGANYTGELGLADGNASPTPRLAEGENFASISAGYLHTLALKTDGSAWSFGWNGAGQLGDGTFKDQVTQVGVVNSQLSNFLDLAPNKPRLPIPAGKQPPFLVGTQKLGSNSRLTLSANISLSSFAAGAAGTLANSPTVAAAQVKNSFATSGYNVYVAAVAPGAPATADTAARPVAVYMKTMLASWQAYVGGPMTEYMRGVSENDDKKILVDIVTSTDLSSLLGTQFLIGYGSDADEMLRAGRYRVVYEVTAPR